MTFSLENKQEVDTITQIIVRQTMTRQASTLHDIKVEMAQTMQEPCDTTICVENTWNFIPSRPMSLIVFVLKQL